jgi:double-stranded uracil-DNA glycosylase
MTGAAPNRQGSHRVEPVRRPTAQEVAAAAGATVPDLVAPGLRVLFCGINPSLYSAAMGCHFARPGNRFWKALHLSGLTSRQLAPWEGAELLARGLGITNLVDRATARADELSADEIRAGLGPLRRKARRLAPAVVAMLGIGAYRVAFGNPAADLGPQAAALAGARLWVLPNPSGLNAHYQLAALAQRFAELRRECD